jgi:hypothetical protein
METVEQILTRYKNIRSKMQPPPVVINRALEFRPKPKALPAPVAKELERKPAQKAIAEITGETPVVQPLPMIKMKPACVKPIEIEDPIRFHQIVDWVAMKTGYSKAELMSIRRHRDLTIARHLVWQIAKRTTSLSYPQMGRFFGDRDHTTVLHAIKKTPANINVVIQEMLLDLKGKDNGTDEVPRRGYSISQDGDRSSQNGDRVIKSQTEILQGWSDPHC